MPLAGSKTVAKSGCLSRQEVLACGDGAGGSPGVPPQLCWAPADLTALTRAAQVPAAWVRGGSWQ